MGKFFTTILFFLSAVFAASGEEARVLRWGADAESGVPNVFYDPQNPDQITGFEYEIAEALAREMGCKLEFYANDWEMLVPGLQRKEYDILLNGIERNAWVKMSDKAQVRLSIPYYITKLQLVLPLQSELKSFDECEGKSIGILKQSWTAEQLLKQLKDVKIVVYDDEVKAFSDLGNKRLEGVLLDHPESFYYASINQQVRLLDASNLRLEYAVMVRAEDTVLLERINQAIEKLKANGRLRQILKAWKLWNVETADYFRASCKQKRPAPAFDHYRESVCKNQVQEKNFYLTCLPILLKAAWMTLKLSMTAMLFAMLMGFGLAVFRTYAVRPIRFLVAVYVECVRGTPLLIQLFLIFYGLPILSDYLSEPFCHWVCLPPFLAGVIALAINYSAYECEVYRAGILSVPRGQMEAALALGMSRRQAIWHVIFPQAIRTVIPPVTNDFIMLLQDSSLVSMITIVELTRTYQYLAATNFNYLGTGILVAAIYWMLGLPFVHLSRRLENRLNFKKYRPR